MGYIPPRPPPRRDPYERLAWLELARDCPPPLGLYDGLEWVPYWVLDPSDPGPIRLGRGVQDRGAEVW